jgi:hypothetical protein
MNLVKEENDPNLYNKIGDFKKSRSRSKSKNPKEKISPFED